MRVLIAEDETIIRLDLRALLERAGFEVCAEARDGEEAVELAQGEREGPRRDPRERRPQLREPPRPVEPPTHSLVLLRPPA